MVDWFDALAVVRSKAGLPNTAACLSLANVDCTGDTADIPDAMLILRGASHLPVDVPGDCPTTG